LEVEEFLGGALGEAFDGDAIGAGAAFVVLDMEPSLFQLVFGEE
jgi:hypothetical protein